MRGVILVWTLALLVTVPSVAAADAQKLVVVVAKGAKFTSISRSDLRRCFLGDPITVGDRPLVPFNTEATTPARAAFDLAVLGMSVNEVGRFWVDRKVRGQSSAPRSLPSIAHVVKVVTKFPNAISYVPANQLTAALQPLAIDGVPYTDSHYAIVVP